MDKQRIIDRVVARLEEELEGVIQAANSAREAATHEESRAEDQHDTRGLEASYLAGAQAQRVAALKQQVLAFRQFQPRAFAPNEPIAIGALVDLELNGRRSVCFLVGVSGGAALQIDGKQIQLITPQAPLGEALLGKRAGDMAEIEAQGMLREYEILSVI
jgi:transcription elongation GreA/GreB family factor